MKRKSILFISVLVLVVGVMSGNPLFAEEKAAKKHYRIGVATLMSHPALDSVISSMKEELKARGYVEGQNIEYVLRNANGQVNLTPAIAQELSNMSLDAVVAITTPMAQAAVKLSRVPVVFSAVTDPVGAKIVKDINRGQKGVTGVSDAWPYEAQISLIKEILPKAKVIGVLYNPGEAASQYGIKQIRGIAASRGYTLKEATVSNTAEVYGAASAIINSVDILYLSSDNTVIEGVSGAIKVAIENKKPLMVGDSGTVEKGGLAAVSVGYVQVGKDTGILVDRLLKGEDNIPTIVEQGDEIYLNAASAKLMGIEFPEGLVKRAKKTYTEIKK